MLSVQPQEDWDQRMLPSRPTTSRRGHIDFDSSGLILEEADGKRWRLLLAQPLLIGEEVTVTGTESGTSTLVVRNLVRHPAEGSEE
jgi:hypothetical protein